MKTMILGSAGQLGTDLKEHIRGEMIPLTHQDLDICDEKAIPQVLQQYKPNVVINTAAYNKVDLAEEEPGLAYSINALGPRNLAIECDKLGIIFVHISTDYVYGLEQDRHIPYSEFDLPGPLSAYGISKLAGEHFVARHAPRSIVIRTCGLYGKAGRQGNGNFVETMLKLAATHQELSIVQDQICTPTSTYDLAYAISRLIESSEFGLYHYTNSGIANWHDFAAEIFYHAGIKIKLIPITTEEFGAKAQRPAYSLLDCSKVTHVLGEPIPCWQQALDRYLQDRHDSD